MSRLSYLSLVTMVTACVTPAVAFGKESEVASQCAGETGPGAMDVTTSFTSSSPRVTRISIFPAVVVLTVARYRPVAVPSSGATCHLA